MLNTDQIVRILQEVCLQQQTDMPGELLQSLDLNSRDYTGTEINEFKRDLMEAGYQAHLQMLEYTLSEREFHEFIRGRDQTILLFRKDRESYIPQLVWTKNGTTTLTSFGRENSVDVAYNASEISGSYATNGEIRFIAAMKLENLVSPGENDMQLITSMLHNSIPAYPMDKMMMMHMQILDHFLFLCLCIAWRKVK